MCVDDLRILLNHVIEWFNLVVGKRISFISPLSMQPGVHQTRMSAL
jgi:hypothetical protein